MTAIDEVRRSVRWGIGHALPGTFMRIGARRGDLQGQLATRAKTDSTDELVPIFEQIRAEGPMARSRIGYATVDHAAVREVLSSNDVRAGIGLGDESMLTRALGWAARPGIHPVEPPSMLATEPPDHTRYRKLVTKVFTVRAVDQLRDRTEKFAAALLDAIPAGREVDLVDAYCAQLPVQVIADVLGVPESDRRRVLEMGTAAAASLDMGLGWRELRTVELALDAFDAWLGEHLVRLRREPGVDLFSQLVRASDEGQQLTEKELKSTAGLVLGAGFETTVNLLGNAIRLFDEHPDQLQILRAEPELWPNAVDEILRLAPPVLLTGRQVVRDATIAGVPVKGQQVIMTVLAGANRDPKVFSDPDRFDVRRENARDHVSFSAGRHFCLGAALARMEGEVALRSFYDRFTQVELLAGAKRRPTRVLRGWEHLPARVR
ncbi:cytochrome P450 [Flexivirga meconopsidis]|uniref:cytochrome P450 n=1 Tax=Flexivirga meconopsidis TaxID=2977121 RepID=UPI00223F7647|nr:cytochrome P450 [Flexivirga meconopsidis]